MRHTSPAGLGARLEAPGAGQVSFLRQGSKHDPFDMEPGSRNSTGLGMDWRLAAV